MALVNVTLKNTGTNLEAKTQTNGNGSYTFSDLQIGNYSVTFALTGFQTQNHPDILIQAGRTTTLNGSLTVGAVSTTVEVSGTPLMNQDDTTVGYVLDSATIQATPLGTGSFTQLALLSPGVNADFLAGSGTNSGLGNQSIWANGQRDSSNSFSVNGINTDNLFNGKSSSQIVEQRYTLNTGTGGARVGADNSVATSTSVYAAIGQALPTPPTETLESVRVNTSMYDASQGAKSGAHIEAITKSGTNEFHGQAYEYKQSDALNAASFFRNNNPAIPADQKVAPLHYDRFGGSIGGPVLKNKLFFFGAYQGIRTSDRQGGQASDTVPQHLTDDRSAAALSNVANVDFGVNVAASQIDPAALKLLQAKYNGQYVIPTPNIDAVSAKTLGYNVLLPAGSNTFVQDEGIGSIDYNFSERDRLAVKGTLSENPTQSPYAFSTLPGYAQTLDAAGALASISNTTVLSPRITWEQRAGYTRSKAFSTSGQPLTAQDAGINLFGLSQLPAISLNTADKALNKGLTLGSTSNLANTGMVQNKWVFSTSLTAVLGRHTITVGASDFYTQLNVLNRNNQLATLKFNLFTDFLTGTQTPNSSTFYNGSSNRYYRSSEIGAFVQDNWKVTPGLTVNLGVRYDWDGPFTEKYGKLVNFYGDQYQYNASTDTIVNSGLVFAGNNPTFHSAGVSDSTLRGRQWAFAPRVGVAWSPAFAPKFTLRAGFGIYVDRGQYFTELSPGAGRGVSGPFGVTLAAPFTVQITNPAGATLSTPFGSTPPPTPNDPNLLYNLLPNLARSNGTGAVNQTYLFGGYDSQNTLPYTENWSLDAQWQPTNSTVVTLGYTGNRGVHEVLPIPFNQPGVATPTNPINGQIYSYGFNVTPLETIKSYDGGNTSLRVPYIGYSTNAVLYKAEGVSSYNALQAGVRKRLSKGLQAVASYTWSHALDEQSGLGLFYNGNNPATPRQSYGTSAYDRTHVFNSSVFYELPHLVTSNGFIARLTSGWGLSGVFTAQSGQAFNNYDYSGAVAGQFYANNVSILDPVIGITPGTTVSQAQLQGTTGVNPSKPYISPSSEYIPTLAPGTNGVPPCSTVNGAQVCDTYETSFGNGARNVFRAPFQTRIDLSLLKETKITERFSLKLQMDAFNALNHTSFDAPNNSTSLYSVNSSTGAVTVFSPSSTFGYITRTLGSPRFLQFSAHVIF